MKKPKITVEGTFTPTIEGINAGQVCKAYEEMMDELIDLHGLLESLTYTCADKRHVEQALKDIKEKLIKAGCTE